MSDLDPRAGAPAPAAPAASGPEAAEPEAWAAVVAAWSDDDAHRRYLGRFVDLEGLSLAGARYKAVLDARPEDEVALRMRAEVVKKAMIYGMAAFPRTPPPAASPLVKRLKLGVALSAGSLTVWLLYKLVLLVGARS